MKLSYAIIFISTTVYHGVTAASDASHVLWYSVPAQEDFFDALPIGNGRLGAMIHGYTDQELIRLNEESIWSGGPIPGKIPSTAQPALASLRQQILDGRLTEADENWTANFTPAYDDMRRYQPAGELRIDFGHESDRVVEYTRSLDISSGVHSTSYKSQGVTYLREAFASHPVNVLVFKLSADQTAALNFSVSLSRDQNVTELATEFGGRTLLLSGTGSEDDTYRFTSKARLVTSDGNVTTNGTSLEVRGSKEAWIVYTAETAYRYANATAAQLETAVDDRLTAAIEAGYDDLRAQSVDDFQQYYNRTSIDLGTSGVAGSQNTSRRLDVWKNGDNITSDPELMALQFNYGKYLLIQSSRPGTLPANLQGIWNRDFDPPWDSKFTLNVNLEMNYWLAQPLALRQIAEPVVDFLDKLATTGRAVASGMYGADGWCCHHNTDITGDCTPYHGLTIAAPYPLGGAWVAFEAIEHFRFTGDVAFARARVLPLLEGILAFVYSWATQRADGYYVTSPSCSPENSYVIPANMSVAGNTTGLDAGATNDRALMHEVLSGYVEMASALGQPSADVDRAAAFRARILGPQEDEHGRLLEYSRAYAENDPGHRHFSPLVAAYPGAWIAPLTTPAHAARAYGLLRHRMDAGSGGTSWSLAWASALHARLLDADHALEYAVALLADWTHANLLSRNGGYFQIDGNLGFTAAVVEMLLQSHAGVVHLGPAIPARLPEGRFVGWRARGGFKIDMLWVEGEVVDANITSMLGKELKLRVGNGTLFRVNGGELQSGDEVIATQLGEEISISTR
ncbi:Six-hairpin glycosidase-like protein [Xylariomycetidae sp. FL0641]|nr:Six-hairpin glycosidase-like protein [Xylariomycetidae sp. FL0641]